MIKFTNLTKEQQEHFKLLMEHYEIPEGTTHVDPDDDYETSFMMKSGDDWYIYTQNEWIRYNHPDGSVYYPLPSPPYYDPNDVALNANGVAFNLNNTPTEYLIDIEAINEVSELIQQNNSYRTNESLHGIRKGIWELIKRVIEDNSWMLSTGGVTIIKHKDSGVVCIDVLYSPCRDCKIVTMTKEELEDI